MINAADYTTTIQTLLSPTLTKLNIFNYTLDISCGKSKGDGYVSEIYRVKVKHGNGEIDLIVKSVIDNEDHRKLMHAEEVFKNEIAFYTTVFPVLDQFQRERRVSEPVEIAKCYATSLDERKEALVLEDLKAAGYLLCNRRKPLDEAHIALALRQYGKLHALSFGLRDQRPEDFKRISASLTDIFPLVFSEFIESFRPQILKNAEMLKERGLIAESELAKEIAAELEHILLRCCQPDDPYTVVIHGDCWCNNMMFKSDNVNGKPSTLRFLDFQLSKPHSPAHDVAYFFYLSAPKHIIDNVDKYLQIYYDSLSDFLRELGSDPAVVFPFSAFLKHWKMYRKFSLAIALVAFRFVLAEGEETPELTTKENLNQTLVKDIQNQEEHDNRITDIVAHFVKSASE